MRASSDPETPPVKGDQGSGGASPPSHALDAFRLEFDYLCRTLQRLGIRDADVEDREREGQYHRIVFDRQAVRYRTAIQWARWIFALLSPSMRAGDALVAGGYGHPAAKAFWKQRKSKKSSAPEPSQSA